MDQSEDNQIVFSHAIFDSISIPLNIASLNNNFHPYSL